jgi:hypothetical protein
MKLNSTEKMAIEKRAKIRKLFSSLPKFIKKTIYKIVHFYRIAVWKSKGCPVPPPHAIKQNTIKAYNKNNKYKYFIETGTFLGDMLEALQDDFEILYSCELVPFIHELASKRFEKNKNIKIFLGDSTYALPKMIAEVNAPAIFWLDGHYSGGDTGWSNVNAGCPIYDEITAIFASPFQHTIIIDDARCFNGDEIGYPVLEDFIKTVKEKYPIKSIEVKHDLIRIEK